MKAENVNTSARERLARCGIVVAMIAILCPSAARGQDANWTGGTGDWFDSGNWLFGDIPDSNQKAYINNGGTAFVSTAGAATRDLTLGDASGDGSLRIDGGSLTAGGRILFGHGAGSVGTLSIGGGSLTSNSEWKVGYGVGAVGTIVQTGGTIDLRSSMVVADRDAVGSYTISDGVLNVRGFKLADSDRSTGSFTINGGTVVADAGSDVDLRTGNYRTSRFTQTAGSFRSTRRIYVGGGSTGSAVWDQSGGVALVQSGDGVLVRRQGVFNVRGAADLTMTRLRVYDSGQFVQSGGSTVDVTASQGVEVYQSGQYQISGGALDVTGADGIYLYDSGGLELGGGQLTTTDLTVGQVVPQGSNGPGSLAMTGASANVSVSGKLSVGPEGTFTAVPGATIHFTGSDFENLSTNESALGGLENVTFVFEGGTDHWSTFEVAGRDIGLQPSGFVSNFALGGLEIGGALGANLRLQDIVNNGNRSSAEALYVHDVTLAGGTCSPATWCT